MAGSGAEAIGCGEQRHCGRNRIARWRGYCANKPLWQAGHRDRRAVNRRQVGQVVHRNTLFVAFQWKNNHETLSRFKFMN